MTDYGCDRLKHTPILSQGGFGWNVITNIKIKQLNPPLQIPGLPRDRIPSIPRMRSPFPSRFALIPDQKSDRLTTHLHFEPGRVLLKCYHQHQNQTAKPAPTNTWASTRSHPLYSQNAIALSLPVCTNSWSKERSPKTPPFWVRAGFVETL